MSDLIVTNADLVAALGTAQDVGGLVALSKREIKGIKASYAITKAIRLAEQALKDYETERGKLVERFAEKDADGKPVMLDETHVKIADVAGFQAAFEELLSVNVPLAGVSAVTVEQLEGSGATPRELLTAGPFVVESTN